ncbi:hypothetical protein NN561_017298 [Cricetulus griseus]
MRAYRSHQLWPCVACVRIGPALRNRLPWSGEYPCPSTAPGNPGPEVTVTSLRKATSLVLVCDGLGRVRRLSTRSREALDRRALRGGGGSEAGGNLGTQVSPSLPSPGPGPSVCPASPGGCARSCRLAGDKQPSRR